MIELLLVAAAYRVPHRPSWVHRWDDGPKRISFEPRCFDELLDKRPPVLLLSHRWESIHGRFVRGGNARGWGAEPTHLEVAFASRSSEVVGPLAAGAVTWCSPGIEILDFEDVEDADGPLRRVYSGHLQEVSLTGRPACWDHRAIGWRFAA